MPQAELARVVGAVAGAAPGEERGVLGVVEVVTVGLRAAEGSAGREAGGGIDDTGNVGQFQGRGLVSGEGAEQVVQRLSSGHSGAVRDEIADTRLCEARGFTRGT